MKYSQQIGIIASLALIGICFLPWIEVPSLQITLDGYHGRVNNDLNFGRQGFPHTFFCVVMIILFLLNKIWSKRINIFIAFFNLGWAIKNYLIFSMCRMGECPVVEISLYLVVFLALLIQIMTFLPKLDVKK